MQGTAGLERRLEALAAARSVEQRARELRRRRDRSLAWHALVLVLVLGVMAAVHLTRRIPNPERAAAVLVTEAMDAAFEDWRAGRLELTPEPGPVGTRLRGAVARRFGEPVSVLTGEAAAGECYGMSWDEAGARQGRLLARGLPCRPTALVASGQAVHFARVAVVLRDPAEPYPWDRVLPPVERDRYWYLPAMVALGGVALAVLTRIVTIAISGVPARDLTRRRRR